MHKRISPHGDYDHIGEGLNLVNNFKIKRFKNTINAILLQN